MRAAVLFIIFKREDTTLKVFERIREARPPKLYVAADGPRIDRTGEKEACQKTRAIIDRIDWPCEIHKLFRDKNMGCGHGVSDAITWFFSHEAEGIILEDDILPHIDFFSYCDEMLEKYRDNERIQMICGHSVFIDGINRDVSYYMSSFMHIWGWATWRRVWTTYKLDAALLPKKEFLSKLGKRVPLKAVLHFKDAFHMMVAHNNDTWDYQMYFNQILYDRYSIISYKNLTTNIGFASVDAVHTDGKNQLEENNPTFSPYPIIHPLHLDTDLDADYINMINSHQYINSIGELYFRKLKRIVKPTLTKWGIYSRLKILKKILGINWQ